MNINSKEFTEVFDFLSSYLQGVDRKEVECISDSIFITRYKEDDLIVQEGSLASTVYAVRDGLVKVGKYAISDKRRVLRFLTSGGWFGLESLFMEKQESNIQYARAVTDAELILVERGAFRELLKSQPDSLFSLCNWLSREVATLELKLTRDFAEGAKQNLCFLLVALAERFGEDVESGTLVNLKLPNHTLANLLGITTETLRRLIKKMSDDEIIRSDGTRITIKDKESLKQTANINDFYLDLLKDTF
ncbi:MAG: Crp/Fnr family transcriptional regulator [Candidatus Bipolaricaulota bacterium]